MGLMRDRIASLANKGGDYVHRVVQIEFNAWHYHDTNLWASLAMRIFEGLALELAGKKESDVEAIRKELHQKLRSSEARRNEAKDRRTQALSRRAKVSKDLEDRRAERAELEKRSVTLRLAAAWSVVTTDPMFKEFRVAVKGLGEHFGINRAINTAEDVERLRQDIEETSGRALGLFTAIGQRFHGLTRIAQTTALLVLAVTAALGFGRGFEWVAEYLKIKLPDFSPTVVEVAAIVTTATAWCGRRVKEIRSAVDYIGKVETALAAAEKTVLPVELQKLQTEILNLDKAIHQASEELAAAEREFADATAEIDRINRGGLVYDFLQERRSSASYIGHLGLISTIRQDLDRLGMLLKDFAKEGENPIERIILYIDDLDRCHPDKVVEVLQRFICCSRSISSMLLSVWMPAGWSVLCDASMSALGYKERRHVQSPGLSGKDLPDPLRLGTPGRNGFKRLIAGIIETRSQHLKKESERVKASEQAGERQTGGEQKPVTEIAGIPCRIGLLRPLEKTL
jgi:Skp family chaperone for outer membrane proteins